MSDWTKDKPSEEGNYLVIDEGGGPTMYVFKRINGHLMYCPEYWLEKYKRAGTLGDDCFHDMGFLEPSSVFLKQ